MWACYNGRLITQKAATALSQQLPFANARSLLETMRWENSKIYLAPYHWQRLFSGMEALRIPHTAQLNPTALGAAIEKLTGINGKSAGARVRLQLAPATAADAPPTYLISCADLPQTGLPLTAGVAQNISKTRQALSHLKTADRQIYNLAAAEAGLHGWDEALIANDAGRIIESTIANIFWVENKNIFTPPLSEGCIAGVMRSYLLARLPRWGFWVAEALLTPERLAAADEVFLASALRGIRPVINIPGINNYKNDFFNQILHHITIAAAP